MKMNLSDLTKNLRAFRYGKQPRPMRDWFILLSVCGLLLIISILANLWYFAKVTGGENIGTVTTLPNVHTVPLEPVTTIFQERAAERLRYISEYRFVDPSRPGR